MKIVRTIKPRYYTVGDPTPDDLEREAEKNRIDNAIKRADKIRKQGDKIQNGVDQIMSDIAGILRKNPVDDPEEKFP